MLTAPPLDHYCLMGLRPVVAKTVRGHPSYVRRMDDLWFLLWLLLIFFVLQFFFKFFFVNFFFFFDFFFFGVFLGFLLEHFLGIFFWFFFYPATVSLVQKVRVSR